MKKISIKYFNGATEISKIEKGDWIDLRANETIIYGANEFHLIPLGVAMELPKNYEAHIAPRGSTFKNYHVIQTNSVGVVDESYKGDDDQWFMPVYSLESGQINSGDRICQFRIVKKMPTIKFVIKEFLGNKNRGSHGSTGTK